MSDEKPADDLRSLLSASFDEAMSDTALSSGTVAAAAAKVEADPAEQASEAAAKPAADRARGEDGKFAKKAAAEDKSEADKDADKAKTADPKPEEPKAEATPDADKDADKTAAPKADGKEAPANWSASDKAMYKLQPPEVQDFLLRRHKAMEADYGKKVEAVADLRKEFGPIQEMFQPHLEVLKQKGLTPASTIRAWANVETALANGKGIDVIKGMVQGYGIDKAALGKALGFTSSAAAELSTDPAKAAADPAAASPPPLSPALEQELRDLRARIDARDQETITARATAARQREDQVDNEIKTFKGAANEKGELLHPYFDEVESAMLALAQSYVASKQPIPALPELYETAVWANPSTRTAMLANQRAADQARIAEEARAKAASARKAGSSVTGSPGSGQATRPIRAELSLREQLEEAAADSG